MPDATDDRDDYRITWRAVELIRRMEHEEGERLISNAMRHAAVEQEKPPYRIDVLHVSPAPSPASERDYKAECERLRRVCKSTIVLIRESGRIGDHSCLGIAIQNIEAALVPPFAPRRDYRAAWLELRAYVEAGVGSDYNSQVTTACKQILGYMDTLVPPPSPAEPAASEPAIATTKLEMPAWAQAAIDKSIDAAAARVHEEPRP